MAVRGALPLAGESKRQQAQNEYKGGREPGKLTGMAFQDRSGAPNQPPEFLLYFRRGGTSRDHGIGLNDLGTSEQASLLTRFRLSIAASKPTYQPPPPAPSLCSPRSLAPTPSFRDRHNQNSSISPPEFIIIFARILHRFDEKSDTIRHTKYQCYIMCRTKLGTLVFQFVVISDEFVCRSISWKSAEIYELEEFIIIPEFIITFARILDCTDERPAAVRCKKCYCYLFIRNA